MNSLIQLQTFVQLYYLGSFGAAAEALHITQPTVSKRLAELEHNLGARLLDRKPNSQCIELTAEGQQLLSYAEPLLEQYKKLQQHFQSKAEECKKIAIGCAETLVYLQLADSLKAFTEQHPVINLNVRINSSARLYELLLQGDLDLALMIGLPVDKRVLSKHLRHCSMGWYSAKPQLGSFIPLDQLVAESALITFGEDTPPYQNLCQLLDKHHLHGVQIHSCTSLHSIIKMTEAGMGIGLLPSDVVQEYIDNGRLFKVNSEPCHPLNFYGCYLRDNVKAPYLERFMA